MDRAEALRLVRLGTASERLAAARSLLDQAVAEDEPALVRAREREPDSYVLVALDAAIGQFSREEPPESPGPSPLDGDRARDDAYARATEDVTRTIVHELRRFVGLVRIAARGEVRDFDGSRTHAELERLSSLMDAVERLGRAAATPSFEEFDLAGLLLDLCSREAEQFALTVDPFGANPLVVTGDPGLVELAARNGLVNACESTTARHEADRQPIVLTWGETDRDMYVGVLDRGTGLPPDLVDPFQFATSRKEEHLGVGLALAHRALKSLDGNVRLASREGGGAVYEIRWPKPGAVP